MNECVDLVNFYLNAGGGAQGRVGGHETEAEAPEGGDMCDQLGGQREHGRLVLVSSI